MKKLLIPAYIITFILSLITGLYPLVALLWIIVIIDQII